MSHPYAPTCSIEGQPIASSANQDGESSTTARDNHGLQYSATSTSETLLRPPPALIGEEADATATNASPAESAQEPRLAGIDIQPGTYRATNPDGLCYWERLSGFRGTVDEIITNGFVQSGAAVVTIAETDAGFSSQNCGSWEPAG